MSTPSQQLSGFGISVVPNRPEFSLPEFNQALDKLQSGPTLLATARLYRHLIQRREELLKCDHCRPEADKLLQDMELLFGVLLPVQEPDV